MNEKKYLHMGQRLEEERTRLGLNKSAMASIGEVANSAYGNYEKGDRAPDGGFLALIAQAGVDVQYVLTGIRGNTTISDATLTADEQEMLSAYRNVRAKLGQ